MYLIMTNCCRVFIYKPKIAIRKWQVKNENILQEALRDQKSKCHKVHEIYLFHFFLKIIQPFVFYLGNSPGSCAPKTTPEESETFFKATDTKHEASFLLMASIVLFWVGQNGAFSLLLIPWGGTSKLTSSQSLSVNEY